METTHLNKAAGSLTYTGVPPEDVPVEDVERKMPEASWDLAVEVLAIERTEQRSHKHLIRPPDRLFNRKHNDVVS